MYLIAIVSGLIVTSRAHSKSNKEMGMEMEIGKNEITVQKSCIEFRLPSLLGLVKNNSLEPLFIRTSSRYLFSIWMIQQLLSWKYDQLHYRCYLAFMILSSMFCIMPIHQFHYIY
jgi:hypothetical protein